MFLNGSNQVGLSINTQTTSNGNTQQLLQQVAPQPAQTAQGTPGLIQSLDQLEQWIAGEAKVKEQCRWHRDQFPLSLYVDFSDYPTALSEKEFNMLLYKALGHWQKALPTFFQWHMLSEHNKESADITLHWQDVTTNGREYEVGHAKRTLSGKKDLKGVHLIKQVTITLITEPAIDKTLSPEGKTQRLYATLLHELGHSLGLEHSSSETDIMFHQGWQNTQLTAGDIQAVQQLYK